MRRPIVKIAPLLFFSGACALLYQTVWLREFRLIFGASTSASAAVLAIFMGGLGAGGLVLGKRIDGKKDPLMWYANLELGVAVLAGLTPFLVDGSRFLYSALGGTVSMGAGLGTVFRLLLSAVVLAPVTFLMGGTLPAAAKAAETEADVGRRNLAVLYGVNTLGAVAGVLFSTFFLLEVFGGRLLLWMCCLLNALLAVIARGIARGLGEEPVRPASKNTAKKVAATETDAETSEKSAEASSPDNAEQPPIAAKQEHEQPPAADRVPAGFVLAAAAIVGFAFLLMELVFYRMLGPILGGSSYTFGLILVFALLGVGLGGAAYPLWARNRAATVSAFAISCLLEALCFLIPFALGDRIALMALALRALQSLGFYGLASGWAAVAAIVVFPAAFVSGFQFPLLMALLGSGRKNVARHVGLAYAWNTVGSIVGSLAGGFGLIPWLTAPGVWRLSALLLGLLGAAAAGLAFRSSKRAGVLVAPAFAAVACVLLARSTGPTAGFRHSPIGAGRADQAMQQATTNSLRDWMNRRRRSIAWEEDGVESSVALSKESGYSFVVNGKVDGNVRLDAGTQVMSGLLGAILHPNPTSTLVVGLGTGSTAGWLGSVPSMDHVDVVELEPAILRVARDCAPVNQNVLDNPKVHISIGDAREVLLTTKKSYDIIFSEPSNPYRAGIASLFTKEFYDASIPRLNKGGIFIQWLQAYEIDGQTVRTVYSTLASSFAHVETWFSQSGDLLLLASQEHIEYDADTLRRRMNEEPYRTAIRAVWRVFDLEGLLAHHVANDGLSRAILEQEKGLISTDDRNLLEFSFARTVGRNRAFDARQVFEISIDMRFDHPLMRGVVDWAAVDDRRMAMFVEDAFPVLALKRYTDSQVRWMNAWTRYQQGDYGAWRAAWLMDKPAARSVADIEVLAESYAELGDDEALPTITALRAYQPVEADAFLSRYFLHKKQLKEAGDAALAAIEGYKSDPWPDLKIMGRFMNNLPDIASQDKAQGERIFQALATPFVVRILDEERLRARVRLAARVDFNRLCLDPYLAYEPYVPFRHPFLKQRLACYTENNHPKKVNAASELNEFLDEEFIAFRAGLMEEADSADDAAGTAKPVESAR